MILVITGFHTRPFDRLVRAMDNIAKASGEEVIIQKGASKIVTRFANGFSYTSEKVMSDYYEKARLIVCHAGVGTIIEAAKHRKPVIVVPRRSDYSEHYDNHQLEIAEAASKAGMVTKVDDIQLLAATISATISRPYEPKGDSRRRLIEYIRGLLDGIEVGR